MFASNTSHSAEQPDAQFNYVTMLLPGNGTNGAQNNTFLDASTNNFTITRNGNATQGTFSPYGSNWSNYFGATTTDYLTLTNSTGLGSNNFTIEFWGLNLTGTGNWGVFSIGANASTDFAGITMTGGGGLYLSMSVGSWTYSNVGGLTTGVDGVWHHYAIVRNGGSLLTFKDGALIATTAISGSIVNRNGLCLIGAKSDGAGLSGYISNFRVVNGTAVYTAAFAPPTAPLTAITNTALLTCQSNRFIDNSSNNFTITRNGDVSVQRFSPFAPTAAYSAATIGGSGYFDGSGDSLSAPDNTALEMGSSDFTMEAWLYPNDSGWQTILTKSADTATAEFQFYAYNNAVNFFGSAGSTWNVGFYTGAVLVPKAWNHVAVTRSGSNWTIWVNGVSQATATASFTISNNTSPVVVGAFTNGVNYATGYLTDVRIVKGTAVYTSAFTPPTAPLTAITNTSLLLNFTNGAIFDNSMKNDLETVGNAQISTSVVKFGTGSIYLDGTGDWLIAPSTPNCSFETGDFTIEGWLYPTATTGTDRCIWDTRSGSADAGMVLFIDSSGKLSTYSSSAIRITSTSALTANTWQHFALVRSSGTMAFYIGGTQSGTLSYSSAITCPGSVRIGVRNDNAQPYTGYIDDLRITKGVARYTASFTPPTSAFPNQ